MSAHLDLDDCTAGNPEAAAELAQLRSRNTFLENAINNQFTDLAILRDEVESARKVIEDLYYQNEGAHIHASQWRYKYSEHWGDAK